MKIGVPIHCLFLSCFMHVIMAFSDSYSYRKFNGTFRNKTRISFGISFKNPSGILLYAIDTEKNRLLITTGSNFYVNQQVICNFNGQTFQATATSNNTHSIYQLKLLLKFENNNLYLNYEEKMALSNVFKNQPKHLDQNEGYPIPKDFYKEKKKMYFWIGIIRYNNTIYKHLKSQIGCIDNFYIDFLPITFQQFGDNFSPSCTVSPQETVCNGSFCKNEKLTEHALDCSFSSMNVNEYCYRGLSEHTGNTISYSRINSYDESFKLKFVWKQPVPKNQCLLEIISRNKSLLLFYINEFNQVMMLTKHLQYDDTSSRVLSKVSVNNISILFLNFEYQNLYVKVSNGKNIQTFIRPFYDDPKNIYLRHSKHSSLCSKFKGQSAFRYDVTQLTPIERTCYSTKLKHVPLFLSIIFNVLLLIVICLICLSARRKSPTPSTNPYEMEHIQLPPVPVNHHNDQFVYDIVKF